MPTKKLFELFPEKTGIKVIGDDNVVITGVNIDSRKVKKSDLFIASKGLVTDGHKYIDMAVKAGAIAVLCEKLPENIDDAVTYIVTSDTVPWQGEVAHNFYDRPSERLKLIGITGTNGKTTIATMLYELFRHLGYKTGLISTIENRIDGKIIPAKHTTPDAITLNRLLYEMVESKCEFVFMEVSSHAIDQERISGLKYDGGVFTNISHEHLNYHKTFKEYIRVKKKFFDQLSKEAFAIVNIDDKNGPVMVQNTNAKVRYYGLKRMSDYKSKIISDAIEGLQMQLDGYDAFFRISGAFNAYNLTAIYGVSVELGEDKEEVIRHLSGLDGVEGRFDKVINHESGICGIVDYAHTPDALKNVLATIKKIKGRNSEIITVVGCGGDRDKTKRPKMGSVACELSDTVIMTNDNPRSEDPEEIIKEMMSDLDEGQKKKILKIIDRAQAIKTAVKCAKNKDIILVAGKGHEKYQEISGKKIPFDDKEILKTAML